MRIFVRNIPIATAERDLRQLFVPFGTVTRVLIVKDPKSDRSRGFGFVEMPYGSEAQAAIVALDQTTLGGRTIEVSLARSREDHILHG
jgi:RNA recognition motif-containing protein